MNSFEINKIVAEVIVTVLILFGIGKIEKIPGSIASLVTVLFLFFIFHILNVSPNIVLLSIIITFFVALYAVNIFIKN